MSHKFHFGRRLKFSRNLFGVNRSVRHLSSLLEEGEKFGSLLFQQMKIRQKNSVPIQNSGYLTLRFHFRIGLGKSMDFNKNINARPV